MPNIQVTYTYVPNTKILSAAVNQNFNDVVNILKAHHHDPNIYANAIQVTNSGIAPNAQILDTQLKSPITRSGLLNNSALPTVDTGHGGTGIASIVKGAMIAGGTNNLWGAIYGVANQVPIVQSDGTVVFGNIPSTNFYVASTGSANAYEVTYSPVPPTLAAGQTYSFLANFANTGSATLAVNGQTAKTIKKLDGVTDLNSGDIANGQLVVVEYDGTNFQIISPTGSVNIPYFRVKSPKESLTTTPMKVQVGSDSTKRYPTYVWLAITGSADNLVDVYRLVKTKQGSYVYDGTTVSIASGTNTQIFACFETGGYVYVVFTGGTTGFKFRRYATDLTGSTDMTATSTDFDFDRGGFFCDPITSNKFWKMEADGTVNYYTISGTTVSGPTTVTLSTGSLSGHLHRLYVDIAGNLYLENNDDTGPTLLVKKFNSSGTFQSDNTRAIAKHISNFVRVVAYTRLGDTACAWVLEKLDGQDSWVFHPIPLDF